MEDTPDAAKQAPLEKAIKNSYDKSNSADARFLELRYALKSLNDQNTDTEA